MESMVKMGVRRLMLRSEVKGQRSKVKRNTSKGRLSDNQVMLLIKEKTGVTNSSAFQQLPEETKRSVLIELKGMRASFRQL